MLALPAPGVAGFRGHLALFPGKGGADTVWIGGNDAGQAVGQKIKGSVSDFVYFDGMRAHDLTSRLGHGAFVSIDPLGEAVGTTSQGFPLYYNTRTHRKVVLSVKGRATGIANGPMVAVSASDGTAWLWNPISGGTLSLGMATTTAVDPEGDVVGHAPDGNLWFSVPNGTGGASQYELPVPGNFDRINNLRQATGYERQGGTLVQSKTARLVPIELTIPSGTVPSDIASDIKMYPLPSNAKDGVLTGATDIGTVPFGNVGGNDMLIPSLAGIWRRGTFLAIPYRRLLNGLFSGRSLASSISFYVDIGLFGGAITVGGVDVADLFEPDPIDKIIGLRILAHQERWVTSVAETDIVGRLERIHHRLAKNDRVGACVGLYSMHNAIADEQDYAASFPESADANYFIQIYDDLLDGLHDLGDELGCNPHKVDFLTGLLLSVSEAQSPYPGTMLAWSSPTY
jgi:hypothetical protein